MNYDILTGYQIGQVPGAVGVKLDKERHSHKPFNPLNPGRRINPLTVHINAFNASFCQIYSAFEKIMENLPKVKDAPDIARIIEEVERIKNSIASGSLRYQVKEGRNRLAHSFPVGPGISWNSLKMAVEPLGRAVQGLLVVTWPQTRKQLADTKTGRRGGTSRGQENHQRTRSYFVGRGC
ncbi:hypothetical protein V8E54_011518 [Elaphomyces granulatus]